MFLYNKYKSSKPVNRESGKKTISWSHFSNAQILWGTIKFSDLLRTASNTIPVKKDNGWKKGYEPDEAATKRYIKAMMLKSNIGSSGTAMVAPGVNPCGQPCKCGATRSKHLTGVAADLNTTALKSLTTKLKAAGAGDLDAYLKTFGLHRPLLNHKSSPEPWHVEATK